MEIKELIFTEIENVPEPCLNRDTGFYTLFKEKGRGTKDTNFESIDEVVRLF